MNTADILDVDIPNSVTIFTALDQVGIRTGFMRISFCLYM